MTEQIPTPETPDLPEIDDVEGHLIRRNAPADEGVDDVEGHRGRGGSPAADTTERTDNGTDPAARGKA